MTDVLPPILADNGLALLAFKIGPNQFGLNRGLAYISMRDQVLRARTLVHAAVGARLFEQRPATATGYADRRVDVDLTVIGGGVGGISVALAAAEAGITTLVVEKSKECFSLLQNGTDRLLSTTVYDWPANHFNVHAFPVLPDTSPDVSSLSSILHFPDKACSARELADSLNGQVMAYERSHTSTLHIERGMEIPLDDGITWAGRGSLLVRVPRAIKLFGSSRKDFHTRAVVYAIGFGSEKVITDGYAVDASFWGYQTIETDLARFACTNAKVFIAGGGDGGLQEVLRFAFLPDYHDLSIAVKALESAVGPDDRVWSEGLRDIMFAEDNAARAFMWGYRPELVFRELERVHERVIAKLLDPTDARRQKAVIEWRDHVTRQQRVQITLYDPKPSGRVYALNRFLFRLLKSLSAVAAGSVTIDRMEREVPVGECDIFVDRRGISPIDAAYGTSTKEELLRRVMFRALPNHYSVVA
ncbi:MULTISPECIES: FAD-binding protein [Paraburkholderia]|uniref:FAD-binding protein n=1 Tax=Paraburkholderia TaxID=1822464 RepID=UPI000475A111|nr:MULTISPECIES: FAD-binding protein [Paraburkholderia]MDH6152664.1 hypothetical protein [Paraburkholderia sp. WSM4179]